jgi:hypothetical protein
MWSWLAEEASAGRRATGLASADAAACGAAFA